MLIIVNPYATTVSDRLRNLVVYALQGRFEVDAVDTEARGHATELCREAAHEGYDVVVAFGGDGTVNEAANGLLGSPTPLCCLPGGSANVFAQDARHPRRARRRDRAPAGDGRRLALRRKVDLGVVNGRCFTFASGLGLDASVVERVDANPRLKARLGPYYFTWVAVTTFARRYLLRPPRMQVDDGQADARGRHHDRAERLAVHLLPRPPDRDRRRRLARLRARSRRACSPRHAAGHALDRLARALAARARRRPPPGHRPARS